MALGGATAALGFSGPTEEVANFLPATGIPIVAVVILVFQMGLLLAAFGTAPRKAATQRVRGSGAVGAERMPVPIAAVGSDRPAAMHRRTDR